MEGRLGYNDELDRYGVLVSDLWQKDGLHCGECFDIFINGEWISDRIEYNHEIKKWYLVKSKLVGEELEYLRVRI
ncbi:DUF5348 domain-containing protein [Clostridium tertium]|jgi:hypothetical protein|uniref:DUF5348 domain-containing protein n=1 Tax=Clostridium tertium TaxID=1559 RepID=UPI000BE433E6|nr:DUF5348 domain-containing protein [Clostridium tertium]